jgi:hypothetical protein
MDNVHKMYFRTKLPFLEPDYQLNGAKCRCRHFARIFDEKRYICLKYLVNAFIVLPARAYSSDLTIQYMVSKTLYKKCGLIGACFCFSICSYSAPIKALDFEPCFFAEAQRLYRFSSNVTFLELDCPLSGAKCRSRHFALAV